MEDGEAGDLGHLVQAPLGRNPEGDIVIILHQRMEEHNVMDQVPQKLHVEVCSFAFLALFFASSSLSSLDSNSLCLMNVSSIPLIKDP